MPLFSSSKKHIPFCRPEIFGHHIQKAINPNSINLSTKQRKQFKLYMVKEVCPNLIPGSYLKAFAVNLFSAGGQNRNLWSDIHISFPGFYTRSANFEWDNNQPLGGPFINRTEFFFFILPFAPNPIFFNLNIQSYENTSEYLIQSQFNSFRAKYFNL